MERRDGLDKQFALVKRNITLTFNRYDSIQLGNNNKVQVTFALGKPLV